MGLARAQGPPLTLNVVATNANGTAVQNLTANDLKVTDDGAKQQIVSLHSNGGHGPAALVILFDLLNLNMGARGVVWQSLKQSIPEMPASTELYLYLLVKDGSLYPVHGLPPIAGGQVPSESSWIQNIGPLTGHGYEQGQSIAADRPGNASGPAL